MKGRPFISVSDPLVRGLSNAVESHLGTHTFPTPLVPGSYLQALIIAYRHEFSIFLRYKTY